MSNFLNEEAYNAYFGIKGDESTASPVPPQRNIYESPKAARVHVRETNGNTVETNGYRLLADDNIDDLEQLANIIKKLCNAAWGAGWGEFSPDLKTGEDSSNVVLPQITIAINKREPAEGMGGPKPTLVDVIKEEDGEGNLTGDSFLVYRQWFDSNVEFNIYGRNSKEARELKKKLETLLSVYAGYLKRNGISEIMFEEEVSGKCSLNYVENVPMSCIYYYIRFETITPIRQSLINSINLEIGANQLDADKVKTLLTSKPNQPVELDFFDGDTGITYNFDN